MAKSRRATVLCDLDRNPKRGANLAETYPREIIDFAALTGLN
jgi:hypothetical protein